MKAFFFLMKAVNVYMLWLTSIYFLCRLFERTERGGKTGNNLGVLCGNKSSNVKLVQDEEDS